jgi:sortase (surface protein transpeptidase)
VKWVVAIAFVAAGCAAAPPAAQSPARPAVSSARTPAPTSSPTPFHNRLGTHSARLGDVENLAGRTPVRLVIPALGVNAPIESVGTDPATGQMRLPSNVSTVAWWSYGAKPGDSAGTTVLAAHVDYNGSYGLFFHLAQLPKGAIATVKTANGTSYSFRVVTRRQVPKPALSGQDIFRTTGTPRLVLVTCGGDFRPAERSYVDNVVVYATRVGGNGAAR